MPLVGGVRRDGGWNRRGDTEILSTPSRQHGHGVFTLRGEEARWMMTDRGQESAVIPAFQNHFHPPSSFNETSVREVMMAMDKESNISTSDYLLAFCIALQWF